MFYVNCVFVVLFFVFRVNKIDIHVNCQLIIHMKCQTLFSQGQAIFFCGDSS